MTDKIQTAQDNRYKCSICGQKIPKGEKHYRDEFGGWRTSHNVNICRRCLTLLYMGCGVTTEEEIKIRKEIMLNNLGGIND